MVAWGSPNEVTNYFSSCFSNQSRSKISVIGGSAWARCFLFFISKKYNVEEVLDFVCKSMQLKYIKQSESVFLIVEKN